MCAVRAALDGRVLVIDGIEKAKRNVLSIIDSLLENRYVTLLLDWELVRLANLRLQLKRNRNISMIKFYAPTDSTDEHELDAYYYQLEEVIRNDKSYYKVIVSDFNARIRRTNESEQG
ncbi:hypothetical protein KIN20_005312 [Parelaphostrongylus tenuis]|uniref:ATPase dynein-related AAA domain-containing protein n=1 Tax=Parelaphostrongylus tenuis TaxID=148309 RepID=A0AAD5M057_PARTN|nr:hypothetical protein KIN20_005312 [Parelaphostrongylus tenuis]